MPRWNDFTEKVLSEVTGRLKRRRVQFFVNALRLGPDDIVLDLGSEDGSYLAKYYPYPRNIVLADVDVAPMKTGVARYGLRGYVEVPADGPLPLPDRSFDAVWCNSVIEHVTIDRGELMHVATREFRHRADEHQRLFAREIARIGKGYCVQTPYVHFPIEAHSWLPLLHYLPTRRQAFLAKALKKLWVKQWTPDFYLYNRSRFREHFFDASVIRGEKVFGVTKSLIAIRYITSP